jgi:hypothetical protein
VHQANVAGYELLNINRQTVTQQNRIAAATQEIANQQAQIDSSAQVADLTNKYTNDQRYAYLETSVRSLFHETYNLAYDIAKKAEATFVFERGPQPSPFIQFGYWDNSLDGLQSGERLYVAIKQLEAAYEANRGYDFEVAKQISVRQLNPWALLQLGRDGDLSEVIFDMDYPGHYFRRIKTVSVSLPCVVGPYTSISATLRLLQHTYRTSPIATDLNSYLLPQTEDQIPASEEPTSHYLPSPLAQHKTIPKSGISASLASATCLLRAQALFQRGSSTSPRVSGNRLRQHHGCDSHSPLHQLGWRGQTQEPRDCGYGGVYQERARSIYYARPLRLFLI